ncbi:hypothetical protein OL548_07130 [Lysinibacillus sp. MHQ-1]|nr:hypothetical protein OL548_07130 [Lysinibacillus sp. MHQ-1]
MGDEGSGYYIGQEALRTITRQYDACGLYEDAFSKAVLERLALTDPTEIITLIYEHSQPRICISSIARTVLLLATQNNETAKRIADHAVTHLVQLLQMMFRKRTTRKKNFQLLHVEAYLKTITLFNAFKQNCNKLPFIIKSFSLKYHLLLVLL